MSRRSASGPSCARCLKVCPGDAVGHWSRDWEACDPHRSPHGFPQLSDHVARIIAAPTPEAQKELLRSEDSFNLWQSILRGAGVITGCRKCADVCPVGADYQAMLSDALDAIPDSTPAKEQRAARHGGRRTRRPHARDLCGAAALDRQSAATGVSACSPCRNRAPRSRRSRASRKRARGRAGEARAVLCRHARPHRSRPARRSGRVAQDPDPRPRTCCAACPTPTSTRNSASSRTTASRSSGAPAARPARRCSIRAASRTSATP